MKLILTTDVKNLGKKDEMVQVSDGYGRNYLIPRGLAVEATAANINQMKDKQNAAATKQKREQAAAESYKEQLEGKVIVVKARAGENGKLFGAVASKDIAEAVEKQLGFKLDKKKIVLDEPVKNTGKKQVPVKLYPGITATLDVSVEAE
ncbi:MAG: 50S ribosomal protein L9 [Clostridia bacterium]|nr:50S ribosomal protein L9 [Clostridia bacterium]MBR7078733.1 50S ribosomal protein L9 [Clostridia bacterium]